VRRPTILLPPILLGLAVSVAAAPPDPKPAPQRTAAEPATPQAVIRLFNGKDLTGFSTWLRDTRRDDSRRVFTVRDGMIRISGDGLGYLATDVAFRDYRLVTEFKWGRWNAPDRAGKARDSGIFLHSVGPDGNSADAGGAYKAAIECQVMQGAVGDLMLIRGKGDDGKEVPSHLTANATARRDAENWPWWQKDGHPFRLERWGRINWFGKDRKWADVTGFRGAGDVESREDQWTRVECVCRGDRITVVVNGVIVNEARDVFPSAGKILLQCEGSEVYFRRLDLHPLEREIRNPPPRAAGAGQTTAPAR
jgi:hypothetical protein